MSRASATLYHATILDRDRHPRHCGPLAAATHQATLDNPLCGDVVTFRLVLGARAASGAPGDTASGTRGAPSSSGSPVVGEAVEGWHAHANSGAMPGAPSSSGSPAVGEAASGWHAHANGGAMPGASGGTGVVGEAVAGSLARASGGSVILAAAFEGRGCAVSRASASLWAELLHARAPADPAEVRALIERFHRFVAEPVEAPLPDELGELVVLAGVRAVKSRRGCATLASRALGEALASH